MLCKPNDPKRIPQSLAIAMHPRVWFTNGWYYIESYPRLEEALYLLAADEDNKVIVDLESGKYGYVIDGRVVRDWYTHRSDAIWVFLSQLAHIEAQLDLVSSRKSALAVTPVTESQSSMPYSQVGFFN